MRKLPQYDVQPFEGVAAFAVLKDGGYVGRILIRWCAWAPRHAPVVVHVDTGDRSVARSSRPRGSVGWAICQSLQAAGLDSVRHPPSTDLRVQLFWDTLGCARPGAWRAALADAGFVVIPVIEFSGDARYGAV